MHGAGRETLLVRLGKPLSSLLCIQAVRFQGTGDFPVNFYFNYSLNSCHACPHFHGILRILCSLHWCSYSASGQQEIESLIIYLMIHLLIVLSNNPTTYHCTKVNNIPSLFLDELLIALDIITLLFFIFFVICFACVSRNRPIAHANELCHWVAPQLYPGLLGVRVPIDCITPFHCF